MPSELPATGAPELLTVGRYSDGRTAVATPVEVRLAAAGLEIVGLDGSDLKTWGYDGLSAAEPVSARSRRVLLRSSAEPGATLFVDQAGFAGRLLSHGAHLSARAERWRFLKPALAVVAAVGVVALAIWLLDLNPARGVATLLPERTWVAAGRQFASTFERDYPGCDRAEGRAALDKLVQRLGAGAAKGMSFDVRVANWGLVNAFAMPGRTLMLTAGLIRDARSPEEVAGVLAHEMGHAIELHPESGIVRQLGLTVATKLVLSGTSESIQNLGGLLVLLRYTRVAEREADQRAFEILRAAKISPKELAVFFERMAAKEGAGRASSKGRMEIFDSHPALLDRAAAARARPDYPTEPVLSEAEWQALRGMCGPSPAKGKT